MRTIETHKGNELDDALTIYAHGELGPGGAHHDYAISFSKPGTVFTTDILFQNGPVKEHGVNGISIESLLAICIDRLEGFQSGAYANGYNQVALNNCREALNSLKQRTKDRQRRGVEGTSAP